MVRRDGLATGSDEARAKNRSKRTRKDEIIDQMKRPWLQRYLSNYYRKLAKSRRSEQEAE